MNTDARTSSSSLLIASFLVTLPAPAPLPVLGAADAPDGAPAPVADEALFIHDHWFRAALQAGAYPAGQSNFGIGLPPHKGAVEESSGFMVIVWTPRSVSTSTSIFIGTTVAEFAVEPASVPPVPVVPPALPEVPPVAELEFVVPPDAPVASTAKAAGAATANKTKKNARTMSFFIRFRL
ncbi:hypothetical protein K2X83_00685 [Patescibacteria group bacterium]|nr:hypothetical protein [Patescibacteria group bacterium]